ncbi:MAG: rod shape-determining protein MreC [Calditrichaeota bacterium]|nr:rod shape-determining protein MreC [Calditrichota bacterium]HQU71635.1 rod shape-determining protein MreC [Calditrichia bacterium]
MKIQTYLSLLKRPVALLLLYILLSVLLMQTGDNSALRGIRWTMLQVVEWIDDVQAGFYLTETVMKENETLKAENFDLRMTRQQMRELYHENQRLKEMLDFSERASLKYLLARVVGSGPETGIRTFILNVGSDDGVGENMAVVNPDGLVGKIKAVTPGQSQVQTLLDPNFFVSARLEASRVVGDVGGGGDFELALNHIPTNIPVEPGELVLTSGMSRIYHPGLKIGVVTEIKEDTRDLFQEILIRPSVNFRSVEEVFVVLTPLPEVAGK